MKCFYHYERDSGGACSLCSHPLCADCLIELNHRSYCKECVQKAINESLQSGVVPPAPSSQEPPAPLASEQAPQAGAQKAAGPRSPWKSAAAATWLSVLPGLGFIYLGLYMKGMAIFATWVGLMVILEDAHDFAPLVLLGFWIFQLVYTNQEAKRLIGLKMGETETAEKKEEEASLVWGIIIVIVGALFLVHNFGFDLSWLARFWPLLIIAFGTYLIRNFIMGGDKSAPR